MIKFNKKKILSLLLLGNMILTSSPAKAEVETKGDKIKAKTIVNVRDNNSFDGKILTQVKKDSICKRIFSCDNGWDLIEYNGQIGFVFDKFFNDYSYENIYCDIVFHEEHNKVKVLSDTFLYLDPYYEASLITFISEEQIIDTIAFCDNGWYLVNINGLLGFVNEDSLSFINQKIKRYQ